MRNPYFFAVDPQGNQLPYMDRMLFDVRAASSRSRSPRRRDHARPPPALRLLHAADGKPPQEPLSGLINQREIDVDTRSFAQALRSALRQDPDVMLVGEMRD